MSTNLKQDGITVVKILNSDELKEYNKKIRELDFPEFTDEYKKSGKPYVLGGFGAYGHPSSFHHPVIRELRMLIKKRISIVFQNFLEEAEDGYNLEMLFDRLCQRKKEFGNPKKESLHQDICEVEDHDGEEAKPDKDSKDYMFGGWINLDILNVQTFLGINKTFDIKLSDKLGFAKVPDSEISKYDELLKLQGPIKIEPGHCIIIRQGTIHSIQPKVPLFSSFRLFTGFRLTKSKKCLFEITDIIKNLGVPQIPSGQIPTMYAQNHLIFWPDKISNLASGLKDEFKTKYTYKSGTKQGLTIDSVDKNLSLKNLKNLNLEEYEYSEKDILVLNPEKFSEI